MTRLASKVEVTPTSRVALLIWLPEKDLSAGPAYNQEKERETLLFLHGLDAALSDQSKGLFHYVDQAALKGTRLLKTGQEMPAEVPLDNQLDFIILFESPDTPHAAWDYSHYSNEDYFTLKANILDPQYRLIASFRMSLAPYEIANRDKLVQGWEMGLLDKKTQVRSYFDKQAYYNEIGRLAARNLIKLLNNEVLHSWSMRDSFLDYDAHHLFEKGLPPMISEP